MKSFRHLLTIGFLLALTGIVSLLLNSCSDTASEGAPKVNFESVGLGQVKAGGEVGRRFELALRKHFFALDLESDFLRPFRNRRHKEEMRQFEGFTGLGMLIHAAVLFAKSTGEPEVIDRKVYLVKETIKTQSPSGYIGAFVEERDGAQLWKEYCFHEAAYIIYGLAEDYRHFGNSASLEAARKLADYLMISWPRRSIGPYFTTLGAEGAYLSLHNLTGEKKYLRFAADEPMGRKYEISPGPLTTWEQELHPPRPLNAQEIAEQPQMARKFDYVHIYRVLARTIMQLRLNRIEPRENLLVMSRRFIEGMTRPVKPGMLITGTTGEHEAWHEDQEGQGRIAETCATVYELWFLDEVLRLDGDLRYGDLMERAIYNGLFGAQDPQGRHIRYFTPFSGQREYFGRDTYCCPGNFRRGIATLSQFIYYPSKDGVAVNLYSSSTAEFEVGDGVSVKLQQETEYPDSGEVRIKVAASRPAHFSLRLRVPRWCENAKVTVDGAGTKVVRPGKAFLEITREWRPDDVVKLEFPLRWRWVKGLEKQDGRAALLRGPIIYGLNPARNSEVKGLRLRDITVDPDSLEGPFPDDSVRPDGGAVRVKAWSPGRERNRPTDLNLVLTEFPDPGNEEIYFQLPDLNRTVHDELIRR